METAKRCLYYLLILSVLVISSIYVASPVLATADTVIVNYSHAGGPEEPGSFTSGPIAWGNSSLPSSTAVSQGKPYTGAIAGSKNSGGTDAWARFTPKAGILEAGATYKVYYANINRFDIGGYSGDPELATISVAHNEGISELSYSQKASAATWVSIGQYTFSGDGTEYIEIKKGSEGGTYLHAHSVKLEKIRSDDAGLSELNVEGCTLSPVFNPSITSYDAETESQQVTVSVDTIHPMAAVKVNDIPVDSATKTAEVALTTGTNIINVEVLSADQSNIKTYTINLKKVIIVNNEDAERYTETGEWTVSTDVKGYDNSDSRYTITQGAAAVFTPPVDKNGAYDVYFYRLASGSNEDEEMQIDVMHNGISKRMVFNSNGSSAWVKLGTFYFNAQGGEKLEITRITSNTDITTRVDAIKLDKIDYTGSENTLEWLVLDQGELSPEFDSETEEYYIEFPFVDETLEITPYLFNPEAKMSVNGISALSGQTTTIPLGETETIITITVISSNEQHTKNYKLRVVKTFTGIAVEETRFTDDEGNIIEQLEAGKIHSVTKVRNIAQAPMPVTVVAALCKGSTDNYRLEAIAFSERYTVPVNGEQEIPFQYTIDGATEDYFVKIYIINEVKKLHLYEEIQIFN